jgi:hypothetical protein
VEALKLDGRDHRLVKLYIRQARALLRLGDLMRTDAVLTNVLRLHATDFAGSSSNSNSAEGEESGNRADIAVGSHEYAAVEELLFAYRNEAKSGLQELATIRQLNQQLMSQESQLNFAEVLQTAEKILAVCPYMLSAQVAKANALCETSKFDDAKYFIEVTISGMHSSILRPAGNIDFDGGKTDNAGVVGPTGLTSCARAHVVAKVSVRLFHCM